jgi:hypothetical protein
MDGYLIEERKNAGMLDKYRLYLQHLQETVHERARQLRPEIQRLAEGGYNNTELDQKLIRFIASTILADLALEEGDILGEGLPKDDDPK